jgi:hypothetical protein
MKSAILVLALSLATQSEATRQNVGAEGRGSGQLTWRNLSLVCGVTYRFSLIRPDADRWADFRLGVRQANLPGPNAPMRLTLVSGVPSDGDTFTVPESLCRGSSRIATLETYSELSGSGWTRVAILDPIRR